MKTNDALAFVCLLATTLLSCSQNQGEKSLLIDPVISSTRSEEAFPNQRGILKNGLLNGEPISYYLIGDQAVFQSDILLLSDDLKEPTDLHIEGTGRSKASSRWPNKTVYYTIDPALPNRARVTDAIAHWEANTPIRFVSRTTQRGYVLFRVGSGCSSNVGFSGGQQFINLGTSCTTGNTIHEIGHTLGLWHEQSRVDRDTYVTVNTAAIMSGYETDFQTYAQRGLDGFDYAGGLDFGSIMLYGSYDFSRNGQPTLTKKNGATFIGQRQALSATDRRTIASMYP